MDDVQLRGCTMMAGMAQVRELEYQAIGLTLRGTLAVPDGAGPFPGVLIGHEGPGLDDIQRARAADIATLGYVGLALDYHGQHSPFADRSAMMARLDHLSAHPDEIRALGAAALDVLARRTRGRRITGRRDRLLLRRHDRARARPQRGPTACRRGVPSGPAHHPTPRREQHHRPGA